MMKILFILMLWPLTGLFESRKRYWPISENAPASGVIMLDFDGWGMYTPCFLPEENKILIDRQVEKYFSMWDVEITRSDSVFYSYPINKRVRVVITDQSVYMMYGFYPIEVGGRTNTLNGIMLGDTLPCLVSTPAIPNLRGIADVITHETGHQLGLAHQSKWIGAEKDKEYNVGDSTFGPLMGNSTKSKNAVWTVGINTFGMEQDDTAIISKTFKRIR